MQDDSLYDSPAQTFARHTRKVYTFVPTQNWTKQWTDADLYAKYGLTSVRLLH